MPTILAALLIAVAAATQPRTISPALEAVAQQRVIEIQSTFGHRPLPELTHWSWGEVIAWNEGYSDPAQAAVDMWMASPTHRAVLTGNYTHIGCAHDTAGERHYFVCLLGIPPAAPAPPGQPPGSGPVPGPLPDTALEYSPRTEQLLMLMILGLMLAVIALFAGMRLGQFEAFLDVNPEVKRKFQHFLTLPKPPDPHVCPTHHMKIKPGARCWVGECDWRSPP
jgi:hypothetical protein